MDMENKKRYSFFENIGFMVKGAMKTSKWVIPLTVLQIPVIVVLSLMTAYLSRTVVQLISNNTSLNTLVFWISSIAFTILILNALNNFLEQKLNWYGCCIRFGYIVKNSMKIMDTDFENIEGPDAKDMMKKAERAVFTTYSSTQHVFRLIVEFISNIISIMMYSILLFSISPWIVILLLVFGIINYFVIRNNLIWWKKRRIEWEKAERKLDYLKNKVNNYEIGKDMRLYKMMNWFEEVFNNLISTVTFWKKAECKRIFLADALAALITFVRDGVAYTILLIKVFNHGMSPADFVFYFTLITQYSNCILGCFKALTDLKRAQIQISDLRLFLDLPDKSNRGEGRSLLNKAPQIKFENVSFRYNGANKDTIKNINFTIEPGEKIALVGINGAGKTTIVKLMCNLYTPTKGQILINSSPISEYNRDELFSIISAVFQDVYMLPMSIENNISMSEKSLTDKNKLMQTLNLSDLLEKVQSLPHAENTLLIKTINNDAIDLSGGEKQKLALARAIYKQGKIIILDEPTAALDPIAESKQYLNYAKLTEDCTSIYISHRLASTRFCDRIFFLQNGIITEEGTHDYLMEQDGDYAEMFNIQSQYYQEEACL